MTRTSSPEAKARIRQSPLPVIAAAVALILVVFYGWSQRGWLVNVADIESRDVDMQSRQLERGYETELDDLSSSLRDYAISNETADFARGLRADYFSKSVSASTLVRMDVDTLLILDRELETRGSFAIDTTVGEAYDIPPDTDLLAALKQGVASGELNAIADSVRGIVQRARGPALFAVRPIFDSSGTGQPQGWIAFARAFTSTKIRSRRRPATISISPTGVR